MMWGMDGMALAGRAVATRRGELGMRSQKELAGKSGVDVKTIGDLERGRRWPIVANRVKVESALGWDSGELDRIRYAGEHAATDPEVQRILAGFTPSQKAKMFRELAGQFRRPGDEAADPEHGAG